MRPLRITLDADLVTMVDRAAKRLGLTRSAFTRRALTQALGRLQIEELERRHADGYRQKPVTRGEFDWWISQQVWPDR